MKTKKIAILLLAIVLVFVSMPVSVARSLEISRDSLSIYELQDTILTEVVLDDSELQTTREIRNIDHFVSAVAREYPEKTPYELGRAILLALGDTEEQIDSMPREAVLEALEYTSVIKTDSFFSVAQDGTQIELSEQAFYAEVALAEVMDVLNLRTPAVMSASTSPVRPGRYDRFQTHGHLVLSTYIFRRTSTVSHPNRFTVRAQAHWVRLPFWRGEDMLAIAHTSTANIDAGFASNASATYSRRVGASFVDTASRDNRNGTFISMQPSGASGMAVRVPLRVGTWPLQTADFVENTRISLWHGITVPNNRETSILVSYGHRTLHIIGGMSISITPSGPGISFSPTISTETFSGWTVPLLWNAGR